MKHYIEQLKGDLENVIRNPPEPPYFEIPPHMAEMPDMAELALSPPTTLEELTGISCDAFPNVLELEKEQWVILAHTVMQVLEALNIHIIDLPENYPDDATYDLIVTLWDQPIQYLPLAGYDLECCTDDPDTCPYGEDCEYCFGEFIEEDENDEQQAPFIGGLFNDDGSPIDVLKIPIPDLCLSCKFYLSDDWEDDMLCSLTRNDQRNSETFICHAFESKE